MSFATFWNYFQDGNIPLFAAVEAGNLHVCRELLLQETEAQLKYTKAPLKDTALHLAARKRDNDLVKLFIETGAVVDSQNVSFLGQKPSKFSEILFASENKHNTNYTTRDPKFVNQVSEANKLIILGGEWYNECLDVLQCMEYYYTPTVLIREKIC